MKEKIVNNYLKIEPVARKGFVAQEKETYEEIGIVVAKDESLDVPVGAKVWFDSYMAKKYPTEEKGKFVWFVQFDEVVGYTYVE